MDSSEPKSFQRAQSLVVAQDLDWKNFDLFLRAFKQEKELEVWGKNKSEEKFRLIEIYPFCKSSGKLGPKRREGDLQIPEGIYHIDRFNPKSKFHLSLGINYPNVADLVHADPNAPGTDIFIHGGCLTVGCIPITNPKIEELYTMAEQVRDLGQAKIPVHIFPVRFSNDFYKQHQHHPSKPFWKTLVPLYRAFEKSKELPEIQVDAQGEYLLIPEENS